MNLQFKLRDILNYLIPSSILTFTIIALIYYFSGFNLLGVIISEILYLSTFVVVLIVIGFSIRFSFGYLLQYKRGIKKQFIFILLFGKPDELDLRKEYLEKRQFIQYKICEKLHLDKSEIQQLEELEIFYLIACFNLNHAAMPLIEKNEMFLTFANLMSKLCLVTLLICFLLTVSLVLSVFFITFFHSIYLGAALLIFLFLPRIFWRSFQTNYNNWCKNEWRTFMVTSRKQE